MNTSLVAEWATLAKWSYLHVDRCFAEYGKEVHGNIVLQHEYFTLFSQSHSRLCGSVVAVAVFFADKARENSLNISFKILSILLNDVDCWSGQTVSTRFLTHSTPLQIKECLIAKINVWKRVEICQLQQVPLTNISCGISRILLPWTTAMMSTWCQM